MGLGATYSSGVIDNALDIARGVDHGWVICSLAGERSIASDFERETLTVANMPVELAHLEGHRSSEHWYIWREEFKCLL